MVAEEIVGNTEDECVIHSHPVPPEELYRYSPSRDPHSEQDIADYVEGQVPEETVLHVEKVKQEIVLGDIYEIWDVTTDIKRWWVITNWTNLYSQQHFPSLDYTLSFHIGLMMRLRSSPQGADSEEPSPFDEVFRRQEQAQKRHESAVEAEDYQTVGMLLRECLISLIAVLRRRIQISPDIEQPQGANFIDWSTLFMDVLCRGDSNEKLRQYLKHTAEETWQLVNWLTHDRHANKTASSIAVHTCESVILHSIEVLERERTDQFVECPICKSRNIRTHFDMFIEPDGDYYVSCGVCGWNSHPDDA